MIFLPCHEDLIRTIRGKAGSRSEPWLATLEVGHLPGLTMAHEIGHVLGLAHARAGVMRKRFDLGDFSALRTSRLAFMPHEQLRIRQAMLARRSDQRTARLPAAYSGTVTWQCCIHPWLQTVVTVK